MTLSIISAFAAFVTINVFGMLLAYRLFAHLSDPEGKDGIRGAIVRWWKETEARLARPQGVPAFSVYAAAERKAAKLV